MADFVVLILCLLLFVAKLVKSSNITVINADESSLRCGPNQIIVFGDYDRIRKYALLRCAEIILCGQISTCNATAATTETCELPGMYLKGVYRNPGQTQMQRECCQYKRPKGIRRIREICHVYTIHPTSITSDEFQKIQKEVLGQLARPVGATTFASPIINDKYYLGVQNFVKGIKILK